MSRLKDTTIHSKLKTFIWVICLSLIIMLGLGVETLTAANPGQKSLQTAEDRLAQAQAQLEEGFSRVLKVWEEQGKKDVFVSTDRNDPFLPIVLPEGPKVAPINSGKLLTPLQKMDLSSLKLVAIISSGKDARALVEDSTGMGYIVKVGTYIGTNNGKVFGIHPAKVVVRDGVREVTQPGRIKVTEEYRTYLGKTKTRVVTIPLKGEEK
ncbi:MAG: pilus assembly protein PilP [Deltaproteobacteria bacterium]|nr:pilus assembly protein PilP [Deltaproteobacteria bacterium]